MYKGRCNGLHALRGAVISTSLHWGFPSTFTLGRGIQSHVSFFTKPFRGLPATNTILFMKNFKLLQFLFISVLALGFSACGGDSDDEGGSYSSSIVGRWQYSNTAFVFNSDKTGYHEIDLRSEGWGVTKSRFTWVQTDVHLLLTYDGSGSHAKGDFVYIYTLDKNILTVYYGDGELMGIYKKQSGSADNDDNDDNDDDDYINGHEYVDLGLSVKWATCNVGASKPEEYGGYYAWGETGEKSEYDWDTYKWCNGSEYTLTKYCTDSDYGRVDNKTTLEPSDDVAHVKWGGSWRMPTKDEIEELHDKCSWTWTTVNGVNGCKVTGPNGNSIFLPAAGCRMITGLIFRGMVGDYRSSSLLDSNCAYYLNFSGSDHGWYGGFRVNGYSVRPVSK